MQNVWTNPSVWPDKMQIYISLISPMRLNRSPLVMVKCSFLRSGVDTRVEGMIHRVRIAEPNGGGTKWRWLAPTCIVASQRILDMTILMCGAAQMETRYAAQCWLPVSSKPNV